MYFTLHYFIFIFFLDGYWYMNVDNNIKCNFDLVIAEVNSSLSEINGYVKSIDFYLKENQKVFDILKQLNIHNSPRVTSRKNILLKRDEKSSSKRVIR